MLLNLESDSLLMGGSNGQGFYDGDGKWHGGGGGHSGPNKTNIWEDRLA